MKFMIETMRLLLKHITLNQQITLAETFHTYFTTFQIAAPRRITKKSELPPQNAENHSIFSVFVFAPSGRIQRFSGVSGFYGSADFPGGWKVLSGVECPANGTGPDFSVVL